MDPAPLSHMSLGPRPSALDKGIALFMAVVRDNGSTGLDSLAERLGLPSSTARRIVAAFHRQGLIQRVGRGRYAGGLSLAVLAPLAEPSQILARVARPLLRRLARELGATAHLGVLQGEMVTYLVKEQGGPHRVFTREGGQLEAYCSAIGKVLLAHLPDDSREAYLRGGPFVPLTPRTIVEPAELRRELAQVRDRGHAVDDAEIDDAINCLAVPIGHLDPALIAAISLTGRQDRLEPIDSPAMITRLHDVAAAISARLGPSLATLKCAAGA